MLADRLAAAVGGHRTIGIPVSTHGLLVSLGARTRPCVHPTTVNDRRRIVVAVVIALVGAVWLAQGSGVPIGGGFMVGDMFWAYAGAVLVAVGIGYAVWPRLRRR